MSREAWIHHACSTLALTLAVAASFPGVAFAAPPGGPAAPSPATEIRPAPPAICGLLDTPATRRLMDGLEFNLLWSCGRQGELGKQKAPDVPKQALLTPLAFTVGDLQVNSPVGESGTSATQSETSIAQNPNTGTLCSSFNDSWEFFGGGGGFTGFSRSIDGGKTWSDGGAVGGTSMGDPSLVWRRTDGRFYLATLASGGGLAIWVSTNDCQSFSFLSTPSTSGDDKELLAVDNNPSSPNYGNLYLVWTDFGIAGSPIRATRSTDGGATWWTPVTLSSGGVVQGAWPAVAPNGDVFVAWLRYTDFINGPITVEARRSTNGGVSYAAITSPLVNAVSPRSASATGSCGRPALNGNLRYLASPQIAVDSTGVLHVVYSYDPDGYNTGDVVNVYYRRSTNSGTSWGTEVRLNDDTTTRDQYFPTINAVGTTLIATWYDRRLDSGNLKQDYFKRISTDGGLTWAASVRTSDVSSPIRLDPNLATCYHGDYDQSLVSVTNAEVVQWADDRKVLSGHNDADVWADPAAETYRCVIGVSAGTNTCTGAVSLLASAGSQRVGKVDMAGGYQRLDALIDVCSPTGYSMHFADSPTCDGHGGDSGTTEHNAEAHFVGSAFQFWGMDQLALGIVDPALVEQNVLPASGCYRVQWTIQEDRVVFDNDGITTDSARLRFDSIRGFELAPYNEADSEDPGGTDANLWYFGLNRTVGSASRTGTGVTRACLVLSRTTTPDLALLTKLCN